jgi:prevent-host-death family protein
MTSLFCYLEFMGSQFVTATEFKAKCLSLLDDIAQNGGTITVTKRGKPVATVGPAATPKRRSSRGILKGKIHIPDELWLTDTSDLWNCVREKEKSEL